MRNGAEKSKKPPGWSPGGFRVLSVQLAPQGAYCGGTPRRGTWFTGKPAVMADLVPLAYEAQMVCPVTIES